LPKQTAALDPLWHAVAAASLAADTAVDLSVATGRVADWNEILVVARASDDEHVIKLVHAMAAQHDDAPDPACC
jgi:hypothetical protein